MMLVCDTRWFCGQHNQYPTYLPRVCFQSTPRTLWSNSNRNWKWAARARAITQVQLPTSVVLQSPMNASGPDCLLHIARPAANTSQENTTGFPGKSITISVPQITVIIPLTHKGSTSCYLSNIAFDHSNPITWI